MKIRLRSALCGCHPALPERLARFARALRSACMIAACLPVFGCAGLDSGRGEPFKVPDGFRVGTNAAADVFVRAGRPGEIVHEATGIAFVYVPPGEFTMGSPDDEEWRRPDETQHLVRILKGFYLGKYEVTQAQWEQVTGSNPSAFTNSGSLAPVEQVSWDDCRDFIAKLNAGRTPPGGAGAPAGAGLFRLPTEAEWEYACRAGTSGPFHYDTPMNYTMGNIDGYFPYKGQPKGLYRQKTMAVGSFKPNAWGLYDMHGNVSEWCEDMLGTEPAGGAADPVDASFGPLRVCRGGSWFDDVWACRAPTRAGREPANRHYDLGLRLALSCE